MSKKFLFPALALAILTMVSVGCKKSGTTPTTPAAQNFSPLTANSSWTYKNTPGSNVTITATNRDTMALGKTYRVLTSSTGGNVYLGKEGDNYYRFGSAAQLNITAAEELYLKANESISGTWTATQNFTFSGLPVTANLTYSIKEKGISRTVGGKAFSKVTYVRLDISISLLGNIGGGDFYYAEGVGLIENAILVSVPGQAAINQKQELTAYTIK